MNEARTAAQVESSVTLRARAIGYSPKQGTVTLAAGRIEKDFVLELHLPGDAVARLRQIGDVTYRTTDGPLPIPAASSVSCPTSRCP